MRNTSDSEGRSKVPKGTRTRYKVHLLLFNYKPNCAPRSCSVRGFNLSQNLQSSKRFGACGELTVR